MSPRRHLRDRDHHAQLGRANLATPGLLPCRDDLLRGSRFSTADLPCLENSLARLGADSLSFPVPTLLVLQW